jgi:hypothetical protein
VLCDALIPHLYFATFRAMACGGCRRERVAMGNRRLPSADLCVEASSSTSEPRGILRAGIGSLRRRAAR